MRFHAPFLLLALTLVSHAVEPAISDAERTAAIRTPMQESAAPRINGPRVYGARPGRPFQYYIPVTGQRPLTYAAQGLPARLTLDTKTGIITGRVAQVAELFKVGPSPVTH